MTIRCGTFATNKILEGAISVIKVAVDSEIVPKKVLVSPNILATYKKLIRDLNFFVAVDIKQIDLPAFACGAMAFELHN